MIGDRNSVIDDVRLDPEQHFDVILLPGVIRFRERLDAGVVGDGDGAVAPFRGSCDKRRYVRDRVHLAHLRMRMQFDTFLAGPFILDRFDFHFLQLRRHHAQFAHETVILDSTGRLNPHAFFDGTEHPVIVVIACEHFDDERVGIVRHLEREQFLPALQFFPFGREDEAADGDAAFFFDNRLDWDDFVFNQGTHSYFCDRFIVRLGRLGELCRECEFRLF